MGKRRPDIRELTKMPELPERPFHTPAARRTAILAWLDKMAVTDPVTAKAIRARLEREKTDA